MAGQWNALSTRAWLAAVSALLLALLTPAAGAAAAPITAKVSVTIQAKPQPQVYCEDCIRVSGRVASPKVACRSHRDLGNALRYRSEATIYRDPHFAETDGQGRWSVVTDPGQPLAWVEVIVPKQRIGGVVCKAARAKVTL
jgi:hypothetical protein